MASTPILSKELVILYGTDVIARATNYDLEVNKEIIDITSLDAAGWREIMAGDKSWKMSFSGLVTKGSPDSGKTDYNELLQSLKGSDTAVTVGLKFTPASDFSYETGSAFLTSLKLTGSVGEKVTYSGSFEGTAALTTVTA